MKVMCLCMPAVLAAAMTASGCNRPKDGERATSSSTPVEKVSKGGTYINAMIEAQAKATSWRTVTKSNGIEIEIDFICPDKMRTIARVNGQTSETIKIGLEVYSKVFGKWEKQTLPAELVVPVCAGGNTLGTKLSSVNLANLPRGAMRTVNGEPCQELTIDSMGQSTVTCVGIDGLPRESKMANGITTYSNWNKVAPILPPK